MMQIRTNITQQISRVGSWLATTPTTLFIPFVVIATYLVLFPQQILVTLLSGTEQTAPTWPNDYSPAMHFLLGAVMAPIIETTIFQWAVIVVAQKRFNCSNKVAIGISASLFALAHPYSYLYVSIAFSTGVVFAFAFAVRYKARSALNAVFCVAAAHSLRNAVAFSIVLINRP